MYGLQLEEIEDKYLVLLQAKLPQAIDEVEAFWAARGKPLALADIEYWDTGDIPDDAVQYVITGWPALTVETVSLGPTEERAPGVALIDSLLVKVYTRGKTPREANLLTKRYATAVASVLSGGGVVGIKGVAQLTIDVSPTFALKRPMFIKAARVSAPLRVGAKL